MKALLTLLLSALALGAQPPNEHVVVYAAGGSDTHATALSDEDGVYQINLPAGDYTLCTYSCTPVTVPAHGKVRYDWTSGPGGGHWSNH